MAAPVSRRTRRRLWLFRAVAVLLGPLLFLVVVELFLRWTGFGYPTAFFLERRHDGRGVLVQNNQVGWRFFGRRMARIPTPLCIDRKKGSDTLRIFVLGKSAAFGDPQPAFGLPRMIEAMLNLRHPEVRIEVVSAAMTGINSHAIRAIARDCAAADGDVWVIYMGNNEVVGPFGAGTVFGPATPPLPLIRASLWVKSLRTGQLLDGLRAAVEALPEESAEWGGMTMFLEQQVRADDPRMRTVYHHFERNLKDILSIARKSGAGVVLSTVAVNLEDCPPFASSLRPGLSKEEEARWIALFRAGVRAQEAGLASEAALRFAEAAAIDDTMAELRYRQAQCAAALGRSEEAREHFIAARDLDTLRFRCDSRLNEVTRAIGRQGGERVRFVDAARVFESTEAGAAGELFYEHVHLTFEGNYLLARALVPEIESLLGSRLGGNNASARWPTLDQCARRLGWTELSRYEALLEMNRRLMDPPFTGQLNHDARLQKLRARMEQIAGADRGATVRDAVARCEAALRTAPNDPWLFRQLASLQEQSGDFAEAEKSARRVVQLLPASSADWSQLGLILVREEQYDAAAAAFQKALEWDSQDVWTLQNLAQCRVRQGRREEAQRGFEQAVRLKPAFGPAWLGLGRLHEEAGRIAEAEECYRKALSHRILRPQDLAVLGRLCALRGWHDAAVTNFLDALKLDPFNPRLHLEAGRSLAASGRSNEVLEHYGEAARLAPDLLEARYLYGLELGRRGRPAEAAVEFAAAVEIMPSMVEARLNLAIALSQAGRPAEAKVELERVLRQSPTNGVARRHLEELRARTND